MRGLRPEDKGRSFVVEYDLASGQQLRRLLPPPALADAHLSDLAVGPDGTLAVSDPHSGRVFVLGQAEPALRVLVDAGPLLSPQGLAFSSDGRSIFVADYALGIARIDPQAAWRCFRPRGWRSAGSAASSTRASLVAIRAPPPQGPAPEAGGGPGPDRAATVWRSNPLRRADAGVVAGDEPTASQPASTRAPRGREPRRRRDEAARRPAHAPRLVAD
jgi:hypothetical protein